MDLPLISALFATFSITLYVMLDGFDLGIGSLLLFQSNEKLRDGMVNSILPTWDGNETWLIMAGITLFAAFPVAYGVLLPAFYIPLIIMLLSLGLRGVSFEFRYQSEGARYWDIALGLGSVLVALSQGLVVGGLIEGVKVNGLMFGGSVFDVFRPIALLVAVSVLAGYVVLGAGWLHLKGIGDLRAFAERNLRVATPLFVILAIAVVWIAARVQPAVADAWVRHGFLLSSLCALFLVAAVLLFRGIGRTPDARPFICALVLFGLGVVGFGIAIAPDIVPFQVSLWAAAAAPASQIFLLVGALLVTPMVLAYNAFAYRVFRGKTPVRGWE